jgi:hypothetical protein
MSDVATSAPTAGMSESVTNPVITSTPAAPAETVATPSAETSTPQAETPAGPEGQEQQAKPEDPTKPTAEDARKARNKERWERMKQDANDSRRREQFYLSEIERLKKPADFSKITDPDELLAAKTAQHFRQSQVEDHTVRAQAEQANSQRAIQEGWAAIQEDMRAKAPDFDQVVNDRTPIHKHAAPFIVESEKGGEIAYWLGKNPDAARDLYQKFETAPAQAYIELGRIEARLSAAPPKQVSTAPKPAPVLNGGVSPLGFDIHRASVSDTAAQLKKLGVIR